MSADFPPSAIDLGREADLRIGGLQVRPSRREVVVGGEPRIVEPRALRVLVALARREDEVVARDELVALCWDGRHVGDDAINAAAAKVRRLGESTGAYAVETVPRVGYRLTAREAGPAEAGGEVLLAVLPFENLSDDPKLAYFSDGLTEELLHTLAQRTALKTVGRASSFSFRGADKAIPNVTRQLGCTHVLDGAVRRSGGWMRVSAHLVCCATQTTLWVRQFERELSDIFALQDEIALAVADELRCAFDPAVRSGAIDPLAYDLYLKGAARPRKVGAVSWRLAVSQLEEAVQRAPGFAEAWGALGRARANLAAVLPPAEAAVVRDEARHAARHALRLDPTCASAALAMAHASSATDTLAEQKTWLDRALLWGADNAAVTREYARLVAGTGRLREALALMRRGHAMDPLDPHTLSHLGRSLFECGEFAEAEALLSRGVSRWPDFELLPLWLGYVLTVKGELDRVRDLLDRYDLGAHAGLLSAFLHVRRHGGETPGARALAAVQAQFAESGRVSLDRLLIAGEYGDLDAVFELGLRARLETSPAEPDLRSAFRYATSILFMPFTPRLRRDPRFARLCAKLGLAHYWVETDTWPDCEGELRYDLKAECRRAVETTPPQGPET